MSLEPPPTADRLRTCLALLGWTQHDLARWLSVSPDAVRSWARGARPVPPSVLPWLLRRAVGLACYRFPDGWAWPGEAAAAANRFAAFDQATGVLLTLGPTVPGQWPAGSLLVDCGQGGEDIAELGLSLAETIACGLAIVGKAGQTS